MIEIKKNTDQTRPQCEGSSKKVVGFSQEGSLFKNSASKNSVRNLPASTSNYDPAIPKDSRDTMTPKEVAALLKRSVRRVGDYRREGLLGKFWKLRDGSVLYSRIGVEEFFRSHFVESDDSCE
ncbi:helix-turn-helix domain-containing protein [Leptospira kmetyi]|uniref:helix-turn-helix domain-containing protein n=1 Tax=Leptospira kmetyi TaxID=408139 RepID=UPI0010832B81|nr:helix-turn-helix domain-containing protein [Leptospira kmetyi]TGK21691.1 DNA-binding protein [Leptospira kmetyi]TGK28618.1 DNA-binding protein [Leptospira kmetyi]